MEIVIVYKYQGIIQSENGSLKLAISPLANQANKALFILQRAISKLSYPKPTLLLHLFDSLVRPVLDYGCEIWSHLPTEDLELINRKVCMFALDVPKSTTNIDCYGELGRTPLILRWKMSMTKYWLRWTTDWNAPEILKEAFWKAKTQDLQWFTCIKDNLNISGFSEVWINPERIDQTAICRELQQRFTDQYIQRWTSELQSSTGKLRTYKIIKKTSNLNCIYIFPAISGSQ